MLSEFVESHVDEILRRAEATRAESSPDSAEVPWDGMDREFLLALAASLKHRPGNVDPMAHPVEYAVGAKRGLVLRERSAPIGRVTRDFGSMCDSVNSLAADRRLSIPARECQVMNQCIDAAIAGAIEAYWHQLRTEERVEMARQIGSLAHELRNALASVRMAFDLLRRGQVPLRGHTADIVERGLARVDILIGQALIDARLRRESSPQREAVRLSDLCQQVLADQGAGRELAIPLQVDPELCVQADPHLLGSALANLVQNAVKFTQGGGEVRVTAQEQGSRVRIEVSDRCGGLPDALAGDMFRPFTQGDPKDRRGLGLGLSIAQRAIEAQGGRLGVDNHPGVGCTFWIDLPAAGT